jgi:hypothetical protein
LEYTNVQNNLGFTKSIFGGIYTTRPMVDLEFLMN